MASRRGLTLDFCLEKRIGCPMESPPTLAGSPAITPPYKHGGTSMRVWNNGDQVRLKSGRPKMTVSGQDSGIVFCQWFDENGRLQTGQFAPESLEEVCDNPAPASVVTTDGGPQRPTPVDVASPYFGKRGR